MRNPPQVCWLFFWTEAMYSMSLSGTSPPFMITLPSAVSARHGDNDETFLHSNFRQYFQTYRWVQGSGAGGKSENWEANAWCYCRLHVLSPLPPGLYTRMRSVCTSVVLFLTSLLPQRVCEATVTSRMSQQLTISHEAVFPSFTSQVYKL